MNKISIICLTVYLVVITLAAAVFGFLFFKGYNSDDDLILTKAQCRQALVATKEALLSADSSSSPIKAQNVFPADIPSNEFVLWKEADVGGVGNYLGYNLSVGAISALVTMHQEEDYEVGSIVGGNVTIGSVDASVKMNATGKNNVVNGEVVMALSGESTYAYYVQFQITYNYENYELMGYDIGVYDNNAESMGEFMWYLHQEADGELLGLSKTHEQYNNIKSTLKSNGNKLFGKTPAKEGYDFSEEFAVLGA